MKYDPLGRDDALTVGPIAVGGVLAREVQAEATMVTSFVANAHVFSMWISGRGIRYLKLAYLVRLLVHCRRVGVMHTLGLRVLIKRTISLIDNQNQHVSHWVPLSATTPQSVRTMSDF